MLRPGMWHGPMSQGLNIGLLMTLRSDIPTILTMQTPLFVLARRGVSEVVVNGGAYYKAEGGKACGNDPAVMLIARSLLKPWQFLAADAAGEEPFWALGLASHSGQSHHLEELQHLSAAALAGEAELFCPRGYPIDPAAAAAMRSAGVAPSRLHHPCAGKHLLQIAGCRRHGFAVDNYWDPEHPLQKRLMALLGPMVGEKPVWLTDSCGLPTLAISAKAHLNLWERLAVSDEPKIRQLRQLWLGNIRLVGGFGRLESDLMEVCPGKIIAKEGADGLLVVVALPDGGQPAATCLVKVASGFTTSHMALGLWSFLSRQPDMPLVLQKLTDYLRSRLEKWVPRDFELELPPFA